MSTLRIESLSFIIWTESLGGTADYFVPCVFISTWDFLMKDFSKKDFSQKNYERKREYERKAGTD